MTYVALIWIVVELTNSPRAVAILLILYTAPVIFGGFLAGHFLDRYDRRKVMIIDNTIRGLAVLSIPVSSVLGFFTVWVLYVVATVYGFLFMISLAGLPSILPDILEERHLNSANSLEQVTWTLSGVLGLPLAGFLITALGARNIMVIDALSYAVYVVALLSFRIQPKSPKADDKEQVATLSDAFHFFRTNKLLLSITLMFMSFNVGEGFLMLSLPFLARSAGGPTIYGILLGTIAVGQVVGLGVSTRFLIHKPLGRLIYTFQVLSGLILLVITIRNVYWIYGASLFLFGLFSGPLTSWAQTLRMRIIPDQIRGRTFAMLRTFMQFSSPIGSGLAGWLFPIIGFIPMIGFSSVFIAAPGAMCSQIKAMNQTTSAQNK